MIVLTAPPSSLPLRLFREKVTSMAYAKAAQRLISAGSDSLIISWFMNINRKEVTLLTHSLAHLLTLSHLAHYN